MADLKLRMKSGPGRTLLPGQHLSLLSKPLAGGESEASWRFRTEPGATPTFRVSVRTGVTRTWVGIGDKVRNGLTVFQGRPFQQGRTETD